MNPVIVRYVVIAASSLLNLFFCRLYLALLQCSFNSVLSFSRSPWVLEPIILDVPFCMEVQKYVSVFVIYVSRMFDHYNLGVNCIFTVTCKLQYRATGRGFVVRHIKFADNYRLYSRSHFIKA